MAFKLKSSVCWLSQGVPKHCVPLDERTSKLRKQKPPGLLFQLSRKQSSNHSEQKVRFSASLKKTTTLSSCSPRCRARQHSALLGRRSFLYAPYVIYLKNELSKMEVLHPALYSSHSYSSSRLHLRASSAGQPPHTLTHNSTATAKSKHCRLRRGRES